MQKKKGNNVQCGNKASPTNESIQKEAISEVGEGKQDGFRVGVINQGDQLLYWVRDQWK